MIALLKVLVIICVSFSITECEPTRQFFIPCVKGDVECLKVSTQLVFQNLVKTADPIKHKEISGRYINYVYNYTGGTSTGLKNCLVNSIKLNLEMNLEVELLCVNLTFSGKYDAYGEIGGKKVKDAATFVVRTYTYLLRAVAKVVQVRGECGKKHLKLVNIVTQATALGRIRVNQGDSTGSCDLAKLLNSIWRETSKILDQSFMDSIIKYLAERANEFLKNIPVDDLFIKDLDLFLSVPGKHPRCRNRQSSVTSLKTKEKKVSAVKIKETETNEKEIIVSA